MSTGNIYANLPKVIEILAIDDMGPGGAVCPHCGAIGRYVYHFIADDRQEYGAMKGCFSHFPQSPLIQEIANIRRLEKQGKSLSGWDTEIQKVIERYTRGFMSEQEAIDRISEQKRSRAAWAKRRYGR